MGIGLDVSAIERSHAVSRGNSFVAPGFDTSRTEPPLAAALRMKLPSFIWPGRVSLVL
jgi:hypothetical protein